MDRITTDRARLYCGDCFRVLEELQEREVDGVIIDPPYSSGGTFSTMRKGDTYKKYCRSGSEFGKDKSFTGDNMDMRSFTLFLREVLFSARLKTKDQGVCCVFIDFRNLPAVADALQMAGWIWRGIAVWDKKSSRPQMGRFKNQCEYIVWGSNGDLPLERGVGVLDGLFSYGNVPTAKRYHQTEKPLALMKQVVEIVPAGGVVLDFFMGSGTTGVACMETGRRFIGGELDKEYFETARRRIEAAENQTSIFAGGGVLVIFAIDFDGTLCVDRYPEIGEPREEMISAVLDAQRAGDRFILWTCRVGERLEEAVNWSAAQGLTFDAVNDNLPDMIALYGNNCRKVFADGYIDDRNVRDLLGVEI